MKLHESVTYGKLPYWGHSYHTAVVTGRTELEDGTADLRMECECGAGWNIAIGVEHSEIPDES